MIETHPYKTIDGFKTQLNFSEEQIKDGGFQPGGIWFPTTKTIICGTFPPKKEYYERQGYIHYSSPRNQFWRHIDSIYKTTLYLGAKNAKDDQKRIENAIDKIAFLRKIELGFVDIFSIVRRTVDGSSNDNDLISEETIFDNGIFQELLSASVTQFVFVYSLSRDEFIQKMEKLFKVTPVIIRQYNADGIPLLVMKATFGSKEIYLSYAPIHGPINWVIKQKALKKAFDFSFV